MQVFVKLQVADLYTALLQNTWRMLRLQLLVCSTIAWAGPIHIAFSLASHASFFSGHLNHAVKDKTSVHIVEYKPF